MQNKLSTITLYALFAIVVVVSLLFFLGGNIDDSAEYIEPTFTQTFMFLMYGFVAIAACLVIVTQVWQFVTKVKRDPKKALKSVSGIAILAVLLVVTYAMSIGSAVQVIGLEDLDISTTWLKLVDMQLVSIYVLAVIGAFLMVFAIFAKKLQ